MRATFISKNSRGSEAVGWGFSSIRVESSGQITSKVVKSPNSESEATRVSPSLKGVIVGQFSAEKGMDEAAMEGAVGGGGGHGLASGAVRVSDLDILRDNPGSAASRAAPGRHDREAARAKPAQPAGSAVMAAKELRKLAPALFEKILSFGAHSNPSNARSAVVGKALQAVCICAKRGLPTPEERRAGRPEGCADSEETGTDSQTLVVLTGGRVEDERAVAADVKAARSCVEVLPQHLVDQNVWVRFLTGTAAVTLSIKDTAEALTMFGNALQIFIRANSANAACWGVDLLLAVRCEERDRTARTLVMLPTRRPDAANASLQDRLLAARREWLSDAADIG